MRYSLRLPIVLLTIIACWYGMEILHESGHMLAALLSGGRVEHLDFPLLGFSRIDISPNPHPGFVAWGGPIFGSILPLTLWAAVRLAKHNFWPLHLFATFCLIANGAYLGIGSFDRIGDAGDILRRGCAIQWLWLFGIVTTSFGLWLLKTLQIKQLPRPKTSSVPPSSAR